MLSEDKRKVGVSNKMSQKPYVIDQMISAKSIAARIEDLSREIATEFSGTNKLIVVGLLRGSFVFIADLVRELDLPVEVDFLEASSYGDSMESSREVRILKDLRGAIEGRDVLVVEDIVDTGFTLSHVLNLLKSRNPAMSLEIDASIGETLIKLDGVVVAKLQGDITISSSDVTPT